MSAVVAFILGVLVAGAVGWHFVDRERWKRGEQNVRAFSEGHRVGLNEAEKWIDDLRAAHAAELERLNNVWTVQALEQRKAKVIPAPPDAESRMLELVARDEAQAAAKAIERGVEKIMADERAAGRPCSRAEAELVAKSMFASAMGGAGGMG